MTTHVRPDGDAVGSLLALGRALEVLGKRVTLYIESSIPAIFKFLPHSESIVQEIDDIESFDTAVVLDCSNPQRIGKKADLLEQVPVLINIDHHLSNSKFGHCTHIDADASSTGELVYGIINTLGVTIDEAMAYGIYTAILTDTGSFLFQNTTRAAFEICGEMVSCGVDTYKVARKIFETYSLGRLKLLHMVLDTIDISENGKLSVMCLTKEMLEGTGTSVDDVNGLVHYAKHIEDVQVAALIQETRHQRPENGLTQYYISLRSNGRVDVSLLASAFGGGGHHAAAGFTVQSTLPELKRRIFELSENL